MWYPEAVTVAAGSEPVTATQVKQQCGIATADTSYDALITRMIASERSFVEKYCGIRIVTQTIVAKCDAFCDFARLPFGPVQSISSVTYVDVDGATQTLATSVYEVRADNLQASMVLKYNQVWPTTQVGSRITVTAVVGYASVPSDIVSAILLRIGRLFFVSKGTDPLLRRDQVEGLGMKEWDTTGSLDAVSSKAVADLLENYRCWPLA
jgi:uncharacterized phiE125 gp8 family phage protein